MSLLETIDPVSDYYIDSFDDLIINRQMVRTRGVEQIPHWFSSEIPKGDWERDRVYYDATFRGRRVFVKKILTLPDGYPHSIKDFVSHHASVLYLLRGYPFVPDLVAFSDDTLLMEFREGKTIKQLWYDGKWTREYVDLILPMVLAMIEEIRSTFVKHNILYDLSFNNILIDGYEPSFVDFDPGNRYSPVIDITFQISGLALGIFTFDKDGFLRTQSKEVAEAFSDG